MNQPGKIFLFIVFAIAAFTKVHGQCTSLRQQRDITFNTNRDCAPVDVTDYTITYFFNTPQDPNSIQIRFEWNDPANTVDVFGLGDAGFSVGGGDTEFTATGTHSYPEDENCLFEPTAYIVVDGDICETSEQIQLVSSWARDNNFGGDMAIDPFTWDVCYGNAVVDATFQDASIFNCNINDEPDNPNRQRRVTQFVYGINHDPSNTIRNLDLTDENGNVISITDGTGNLTSTQTVSGVTAAYFGPFDEIPYPADGPISISLPLNAPADSANLIGNIFRVTLFNWNVCNPFNGDYANPNYQDAVSIDAFVRIVAPPEPDFQTRLNDRNGIVKDTFCLGDQIYFDNLSGGGLDYSWEFFEDTTGTNLAGTSGQRNPVFTFDQAGRKLVRLTVEDSGVQSACRVETERIITISPAPLAGIETLDPLTSQPLSDQFCQNRSSSDTLSVLYKDLTTQIDANTSWRWEFYNQNGQLVESIPAGADTYSDTQLTDIVRQYVSPGTYRSVLITRNRLTGCATQTETEISVYPPPQGSFLADEVCEGEETLFFDVDALLDPVIDDDSIVLFEFDFSYVQDSFNAEYAQQNRQQFNRFLDGSDGPASTSQAGTYQVAMRTTTRSGCRSIYTRQVTVKALPPVDLSVNNNGPICSTETLAFLNTFGGYASLSSSLILTSAEQSVNDTLTMTADSLYYTFFNDTDSVITYQAIAVALNQLSCTNTSDTIFIDVLPDFPSGFRDVNYDPLTTTCSPYQGMLVPDEQTRGIGADRYIWTVSSEGEVLNGYPLAVERGAADFDSLAYTVVNDFGSIKTYKVTLEVEKAGACISSSELILQVSPQPLADFTIVRADSCEYALVTVEAAQQGLNDYRWTFDSQPDQRVNEDFRQRLRYDRLAGQERSISISLTTSNLANCVSEVVIDTVVIESLEQPGVPDFQLSTDTLQLPDTVISITQNSPFDAGWEYQWDFGNGQESNLYDPGLAYFFQPGDYQISQTIATNYCAEQLIRSLIVLPAAPIVDFEADTLLGCQPHAVQFTNLSRYADSNTYLWDFGDGTSSTQENPSHVYRQAGIYTVSLYAENAQGSGAEEVKINYIEVLPSPTANFQVNPEVTYIPDQQTFFNNLSFGANRYWWDFGDGNTSDRDDPVHTYELEGVYDVTLIAANDLGCADTLLVPGAVRAIPGGKVRTPNAFTPSTGATNNGQVDASTLNDIFIPRVEGVTDFEMLIYNKWGQLLFKSTDQNLGWNGYFKGQLMPADVYVYKLYLKFSDGRLVEQIGDVTLVR